MLPAWQGAGRLPSSLQQETKTQLTPASPAKESKQMHCELWDLHSLSCLGLFACPAPFLHGNGPLKIIKKIFICYLHSDFGFTKCVTESTIQHLHAQVPTAGFLIVCCAELSSSSEYKSSSDHFLYRCELPFLHSACFKPGIQFLILSKPA